MRKVVLYASVALIIFILASQGAMVTKRVTASDYQEECLGESCSAEELKELWRYYQAECLNKDCSKEEVIELGGTPNSALKMLAHFQQLGWQVREKDLLNLGCSGIGTQTKCYFIILMCKDFWQCPNGVHSSSWYTCGGCLFG